LTEKLKARSSKEAPRTKLQTAVLSKVPTAETQEFMLRERGSYRSGRNDSCAKEAIVQSVAGNWSLELLLSFELWPFELCQKPPFDSPAPA
jgi:hypothetical protein